MEAGGANPRGSWWGGRGPMTALAPGANRATPRGGLFVAFVGAEPQLQAHGVHAGSAEFQKISDGVVDMLEHLKVSF